MATQFPPGWDEARVRRVVEYYENQTEEEAIAEAQMTPERGHTLMEVPTQLVPAIRQLIAQYEAEAEGSVDAS